MLIENIINIIRLILQIVNVYFLFSYSAPAAVFCDSVDHFNLFILHYT